jgi:hypothetical protein
MIYQFIGSCYESPDFQLDIDIDAGHTFSDLHFALQSALGFQSAHLASFLIPGFNGSREIEISQLGSGIKKGRLFNMHVTLMGDMMKLPVKFICYVYDLLNDRFINLQLTGTYMEKNLREPSVKLSSGEIPVQTMDEVITGELFDVSDTPASDPNYGILNDYYEIFGEMEEYVI